MFPRHCLTKRSGQQLVELAVQFPACGKIFAALEHPVLPTIVADKAAGFADKQHACRRIPNVEIVLPEAVEPTGRDPGEIERRRAEPADAAHLRCNRTEDP